MRLVNLSSEDFNCQVQKHYLITLIDVVYGSSMAELVEELNFFEKEEQYEICSAIKKAIEFCKGKTILDIKKKL